MATVTLVCGPPCAGKTTYVRQHAKPGDVVLDQDVIGAKAMGQALAKLAAGRTTANTWVIRSAPGQQRRQALAQRIHANNVVLLLPPRAELIARATRRPNPKRHIRAVTAWLVREAQDAPPPTTAPWPQRPRTPRRTTTERGLGWQHQQARAAALGHLARHPGQPCPRCHHPMYPSQLLDLDDWPGRVFGGPQVKRLAHRRCNRSAGATLGNQLRAARTQPQRVIHSRRW